MLGREGRSLQPAQGGGLVTAGPELVVAASFEGPACGSGCCAVLVTADTALSSLSSSALLAQQGLITPLLEAEKCSVFSIVTVCPVCAPSQLSSFLNTGEREKQTLLLVISSAVILSGPRSSLGTQSG